MKICKKNSLIENLLQTKLTNRKYLKNDYLINVFSKKSLLIKWKIAKNFHDRKICKKKLTIEKILQTKFINTKFFAIFFLINEIIKTNTRTMMKQLTKNCWSKRWKIDRTNKRTRFFFRKINKKIFCKQ